MSKAFAEMSKEELLTLKEELNKEYSEAKSKGLALNMARGKPSPAQLDLGMEFLNAVNSQSDMLSDGKIDTRNYGDLALTLLFLLLDVLAYHAVHRVQQRLFLDAQSLREFTKIGRAQYLIRNH